MSGGLVCARCGALKGANEFYASPLTRSGRQGVCKECFKLEMRQRRRGIIVPRVRNGVSKVCRRCGAEKPLAEFYRDSAFKDGRGSTCKPCKEDATASWRSRNAAAVREAATAWRKKNLRRIRAYGLKRIYGITLEDYDALLASQGGKCAICGGSDPKGHIGWRGGQKKAEHMHIDHDHATGAVRGLLCADCNKAIGLLHEDPAIMKKAIEYIERHTVPAAPGDNPSAGGSERVCSTSDLPGNDRVH